MSLQSMVNILVVDDKNENLLALESILKSPELNIIRALSGNEALARLLEMEFACVLLDVRMPDMDGFELARIIRTDDRTRLVPIIFSSGHEKSDEDVFKGYEAGAVDYLLKPLDPTVVRGKIKVFADLYRKESALKRAETAMAAYANELKNYSEELEKRVADRMKELNSSQAQMAQLQKMDAIGSLAGGVAHDFNNILAAINMYCDHVADHVNFPDKVLRAINEIRTAASSGAGLTRQLLIFSRKQILQPKNIDLNSVVGGMLNMLMRLMGGNIEITTKFVNNLNFICADPGQVEQVVLNLVVNARDAMPDGGQITIETNNVDITKEFSDLYLNVTPGPYVLLTVTDTGMGMDEITRTRLFEPFYTTKEVGKGTGLGLSTVYGIVKQCKGTIWMHSEVGKGTVFKVYLPIAEECSETPVVRNEVQRRTGQETLLIVEDDENLRELYADALEFRGYRVISAANGKEALKVLAQKKDEIHLLLTDVMMPQMGGVELARKASEIHSSMPIVLMSGYTNEMIDDQDESMSRKVHFIQKPFNTEALVQKIHEALDTI